jgi:predicted dehydrogenase
MKNPIRVGVVGAGHMPQRAHIPNLLAETDRCVVPALVDPRRETAQLVARTFGIPKAYGTVAEMLRNEELDAVALSVQDPAHLELALEVMSAGKHLFMEKPLATTTEDAYEIVSAAKKAGVVLQMGFQRRHGPAAEIVKRVLDEWADSGEMGDLRIIRYHSTGGDWICRPDPILNAGDAAIGDASEYKYPEWMPEDLRASWPWLNNYTQHVLDLLRYLIGPPDSVVSAYPTSNPGSVITLDWAGARTVIIDGPSQPGRWEESIKFHYEGGWLRFRTPPALAINVAGQIETYRAKEGRREIIEAPHEWAFRREITHFLRAVAGEVPPSPLPEEALATQSLMEDIFRRAAEMTPSRKIVAPTV